MELLSYEDFEREMISLYDELGLKPFYERVAFITRFGRDKSNLRLVFTPGVGEYNGRKLEISPSHHPYIISVTEDEDRANKKILDDSNPSTSYRVGMVEGDKHAFNHMVIRLEMKVNIGTPSIYVYPDKKSKINKFFNRGKQEFDDPFSEKYSIRLNEDKTWFYECLDINIKNKLSNLELPKNKGAVFQFSYNAATFAVVPRKMGKQNIKNVLDILEKISINIERVKT